MLYKGGVVKHILNLMDGHIPPVTKNFKILISKIEEMANKRDFKKYADAVGASACEAMMNTYYAVEGVDKNVISEAIEQVLCAVASARSNADITFDKGVKAFASPAEYSKAKKEFYKKLFVKINADFASNLDKAIKTFNAAIPAEAKEELKKAVAE